MASHYWTGGIGQYDVPEYDVNAICETHPCSVQQGLSTGPLLKHTMGPLLVSEQSTLGRAGPVEHTPLTQFSPVAHKPA